MMSNRWLLGKVMRIGPPDGFFTVKTRCTSESTDAASDAGRLVLGCTTTGGVGVGPFGVVGGTEHVVSHAVTDVSWCVPATVCAPIAMVCVTAIRFAPTKTDGSTVP